MSRFTCAYILYHLHLQIRTPSVKQCRKTCFCLFMSRLELVNISAYVRQQFLCLALVPISVIPVCESDVGNRGSFY